MQHGTPFQAWLTRVGDALASELLEVKPRTVKAWRLGDRYPRPAAARRIVQKAQVTLADIYGGAIRSDRG
jgi:hypothetical protein